MLLIDADLRRPALHGVFRIDTASGLTDGLSDPNAKLTVRQVSPRLAVLPAGRPSSDPMAGLTSDRMRQLLNEARDSFDWVIIDTPPLGILPDAHLLTSMVERSTPARLAGLMALDNIGGDGDLEGLSEAQAVFLDLILAQQVADIEQGRPASNKVAVASLSARDRDRLREALKAVAHLDELTRDLLFED